MPEKNLDLLEQGPREISGRELCQHYQRWIHCWPEGFIPRLINLQLLTHKLIKWLPGECADWFFDIIMTWSYCLHRRYSMSRQKNNFDKWAYVEPWTCFLNTYMFEHWNCFPSSVATDGKHRDIDWNRSRLKKSGHRCPKLTLLTLRECYVNLLSHKRVGDALQATVETFAWF